jgi:heat shock protein HslJ
MKILVGLFTVVTAVFLLAACSTTETTTQPTTPPQPTDEPASEPIAEPTSEPTEEPVSEPTEEPASMAEIKTLFVGPELVECTGVAPQQCMLVSETADGEPQFFYDAIEGFTFEPGYSYELRVQVETIANPPADGSSLRYILVEEVSKTAVETAVTSDMPVPSADLNGTFWTLLSYTVDGAPVNLVPDTAVTLQFADGQASGNAGCNNYSGSYTTDGTALTFGLLISTQMFCMPEEVMNQEDAYLAALGNVQQHSMAEGQLLLHDADGNILLTFAAAVPVSLTSVTWQATSYNNGQDAVVSLAAGTSISAVFNEDGQLSGNSGCNSYTTSYTTDDSNMTIDANIATTLMACSEAIMTQESAYLAALPNTATYSINRDQLELRDADGALLASYTAVPASSIIGEWNVTSYNNGNQAVVSPLLGTEINVQFNADGSVNGFAGCNTFMGGYQTDGDAITIEPLATTRIFCAEPEGVMDQEAQFLAAMQSAATYSLDGPNMGFRTADDAMAVNFVDANFIDPEIINFLDNTSYGLDLAASGVVTLTNGEYREPVADGSASELIVLRTDAVATGTIDGQYAVATILTADPGGSGTFYYLSLFLLGDNGLEFASSIILGDRVIINDLDITQNSIQVDMIQAGADDPLCCPTEHVINTYAYQDGALQLVDTAVLEE